MRGERHTCGWCHRRRVCRQVGDEVEPAYMCGPCWDWGVVLAAYFDISVWGSAK